MGSFICSMLESIQIELEYVHAYANPSSNGLNRGMNIASLIGQVQL